MRLTLLACGLATASAWAGTPAYTVLHSFGAPGDPGQPTALTVMGDTLYGVSTGGGGLKNPNIVFSLTASGQETAVCTLNRPGLGYVAGPLTAAGGALYGLAGRPYFSGGAAYVCLPDGKLRILHRFGRHANDVDAPTGQLLYLNHLFYGLAGGVTGNFQRLVAIFSMTSSGHTQTLNVLPSGLGTQPSGGLTYANGVFYGVNQIDSSGLYGGVAFAAVPNGAATELFNFEGAYQDIPYGPLVYANGLLYGTTFFGKYTYGVVFSLTTAGTETVLHNFQQASGNVPTGGLIQVGKNFYGTTSAGGAYNLGTVFRIGPQGAYKVLHDFAGGADGEHPADALVRLDNMLVGTTKGTNVYRKSGGGGTYNQGVAFAVSLP